MPEVQHAAALHLATLSHSANVQLAFKENQRALRCLHAIEGKKSMSLSLPGKQTLQNEALQYARWALRTAQGRNIKPAYVPKTDEELEYEGSMSGKILYSGSRSVWDDFEARHYQSLSDLTIAVAA